MIKLTDTDGEGVFINPKYVTSIYKSRYSGTTYIHLIGHNVEVKESIKEILQLIGEWK